VHVIPNGFARPRETPHYAPTANPPRLGFIGLYSYPPNFDGVQWFLNAVWPSVRQAVPGVRFRLVGKGTDGPQQPVAPNVDALGWLDDPAEEIASWSAMVIPIRIGGGTRIKLVDAFSRKCPVVSTRFGAYGYPVQSAKEVLLADDPDIFASACAHLIRHPELGTRLAETAWQEYLRHWTWEAIAPKVWAAAEDCLRRSGRRSEHQFSGTTSRDA
jgi:glycosyltransferase involved in cell wall biosynthesis